MPFFIVSFTVFCVCSTTSIAKCLSACHVVCWTVNLAHNIGSLVTEFNSVTRFCADAKYIEMKRCFIMQICVC